MKKTLVALAVTAFAASASAVTVYDNDGSKIQVDGSLRLLLDNSGKTTKTYGTTTTETKKRSHSNLKNDGTRFGVRVKHDISEDFYAEGRLELRFNGKTDGMASDEFGSVYAHRAYVGLGSKQLGKVTFGRQVTIGDDIAQAGFDNTYGVTKTPLTTSGKSVVRYDYENDGLHLGANYNFAEDRDSDGEVKTDKKKGGFGLGAIYDFKIAEGQSATLAAGYTRDAFKSDTNQKHHVDAAMIGSKYMINDLTLALDYGYKLDKDGTDKTTLHGLALGAKYKVTPEAAVYGNYVYLNERTKDNNVTTDKAKSHRFMLGTEYQFHKQVKAFVEGRIQRTNHYNESNERTSRDTDKAVGVGLRVFW